MKNVLVTGGTGYIGSHTLIELLENNHQVYVLDNLVNSNIKVLDRIKKIVGNKKYKNLYFYKIDITKKNSLKKKINEIGKIDVCIHFAGLKAVGESVEKPLLYYNKNILSTLNLLECLESCGCKKIIFSSSATVYGNSKSPLREDSVVGNGLTNPYGKTKYMIEEILKDYSSSKKDFSVICLRYFNPIGAHPSGLIGEAFTSKSDNLFPHICMVAKGFGEYLEIYGNDWPTADGTCIRDYIHVTDLADIHIKGLNYIVKNKKSFILNCGYGKGYSVLQIVNVFKKIKKNLKINFVEKRPGDVAQIYSNTKKFEKLFKWKPKYKNVGKIIKSAINWEKNIKDL